ncbi:TetR/AcrR family transcriptional repressor of nem operon [Kitasatospora sp. MAP12-15]|uniref:TetR/AcrR family transcriptional regulator n=1 Tax=unclassified Kitasatospora TaxID=2633591 RepID=UPI0024758CBC|nr:TetR/AcrR family transcriptional regulator [Kitasatospora sp. MAP12-44]MDH6114082.1 TetR/AcrR family transcriptional repressor of nem operon [Kitasatospora sp. MAP12-44]
MYTLIMATQERLIESTQELLWERGYVGTSPKAIQQRAGVGQGSMYHHFSGKPDLATTAMRRSAEQLLGQAQAQLSAPGTAYERIAGYLLRERDVLRGCRVGRMAQDPEVIADEALRAPVRETFDRLGELIAGVIEEGRRRGELLPGPPAQELAAAVVAVVQGGYVLARAAGSEEPFRQAIRGALALLATQVSGTACGTDGSTDCSTDGDGKS